MTYEESYNYWKRRYELAKDFRDSHWECGEAREHREWCEHMKNACEALEKADKYRWHDLTKNPEDLPVKFGEYLVCIKEYGLTYNMVSLFRETSYGTFYWNCSNIVAWREMEPFEVEE